MVTLRTSGFLAMRGQIVDAKIVAAPKQRDMRQEKQAIKDAGQPPENSYLVLAVENIFKW
jgi:transposase, IS5 family